MLRAVTAQSSQEMSLEEWAARDEDEPGELVDGRLVEEEMPAYTHEIIVAWFVRILGNWAVAHQAWVTGSGVKYAVAPRRGRIPDMSVYLRGTRPPRGQDSLARMPPSIALEVISSTPRDHRRDRVEKVADYAKFGIRWYWLLDPVARTFEILELGADGRYVHALGATGDLVEEVPGCEGLRLDLAALWAVLDSLPDDDSEPEPTED
jgi:Uma2 family endonuclease